MRVAWSRVAPFLLSLARPAGAADGESSGPALRPERPPGTEVPDRTAPPARRDGEGVDETLLVGEVDARRGFAARVGLAGGYRRLYTSSIVGLELGVEAGAHTAAGAVLGSLSVLRGETEFGLTVHDARAAGAFEIPVGRARLGAGFGVGWLLVARVTNGDAFGAGGTFVELRCAYDLVRGEPFTLQVTMRPSLALPSGVRLPLAGASLGLAAGL